VKEHWSAQFQAIADRIIEALMPAGHADLCKELALPLSAECLKAITGLANMRYQDMDAWSQGMIDGIANYPGDPRRRGALPCGNCRHQRSDRRRDPGADQKPEPQPARRHALRRHSDGQRAGQHQARDHCLAARPGLRQT
jgi:hypothetical protein